MESVSSGCAHVGISHWGRVAGGGGVRGGVGGTWEGRGYVGGAGVRGRRGGTWEGRGYVGTGPARARAGIKGGKSGRSGLID